MAFTSCTPDANSPVIDMHFTFKPAYIALAAGTPRVWLDVCADRSCDTVDSSIHLACQIHKTPDRDLVAITDCSEHAARNSKESDSEFAMLNHSVHVRMHIGHSNSEPFSFNGAKSDKTVPFTVFWNDTSLRITSP